MEIDTNVAYPLDFLQTLELVDPEDTAEVIAKKTYNSFPMSLVVEYLADRRQAEKELGRVNVWEQAIRGCAAYARDEYDLKYKADGQDFDIDSALECWKEKEARWAKMNAIRAERQAQQQALAQNPLKEKQAKIEEYFSSLSLNQRKPSKNQSADKRAEYSQKIMHKESKLDDLLDLERNFQVCNERFISDAYRYFGESEEFFYQRGQYPSRQSQWQQNVIQSAYSHMRAVAEQQNKTLEDSCRTTRIEMEDEIETLYKKRNDLP
ncbi:hypothetical protein NL50_10455 [Clostridium acetobutylicum]|nr:hypothetical protein NL50_10455 [Clostridium acetobutylicum]